MAIYLGSAIGSSLNVRQFVEEDVKGWSSDVIHLAKVAHNQPWLTMSDLCQMSDIRIPV